MSEMGEGRRDVVQKLSEWASELSDSKGTVVPGLTDMAMSFSKVVEAQNFALAQNAQKGAALVNISDKWAEFTKAVDKVSTYLEPVSVAVAQVRSEKDKADG